MPIRTQPKMSASDYVTRAIAQRWSQTFRYAVSIAVTRLVSRNRNPKKCGKTITQVRFYVTRHAPRVSRYRIPENIEYEMVYGSGDDFVNLGLSLSHDTGVTATHATELFKCVHKE